MKSLTVLATLLITLGCACAVAASTPKESATQITLHLYNIKATRYNNHDKINCAQFTDQTYNLPITNGQFELTEQFQFKNSKFYDSITNHGIVSRHWLATWTYYKPDHKAYPSTAYGSDVSFVGSKVKFGIFRNKYCQGSYTMAIQKVKAKKNKFIKYLKHSVLH